MTDFWTLVRSRLARQRDVSLKERIGEDAGFVAEVAAAKLYLRRCDVVGAWARVAGGAPTVENEGKIEIGERTRLVSSFAPVELVTGPGGRLRLGSQCAVNYGTSLRASTRVDVGDRVSIGPYCIVSDTEAPGADESAAQTVEIGDGVWLASRVTVLPGARIGAHSVITAGSVVSGEIPEGVVAGGNPARVLRPIDAPSSQRAPERRSSETNGERKRSNGAAGPVKSRAEPAHRGLLISDFTIDELARALAGDEAAPVLGAEVAPFGQVVATLLAPPPAGVDFAVVWTRPESALPSFQRLLDFEGVAPEELLAEVDQHASLLREALSRYRFSFVATWTAPPWQRGLGLLDGGPAGVTRALHAANARLMERLADVSGVHVLNAQRWIDAAGRGAHSAKLWYLGKVPFSAAVFEHAAADIKAAVSGHGGGARKLVIVDLDDTLWGGIVGDVGWEGLSLGGHDAAGEAFVDFQRALKALERRGVVLAIVSKNEESVALEALRRHPEMVLRESDFVGHRINWNDKADNVADLVASLGLGLQSVVFIDDSPVERARVRQALPEVFVPEWPEDKLLYPSALSSLRCFDSPALSREDTARTELYATERKREALKAEVGSVEEWLKTLDMRVRVAPLGSASLTRAAQLLNKTNQVNLSTRRMTEAELEAWARGPGRRLWTVTVGDRFGDAGLTGIVSLEPDGDRAKIVDFVLSCRVMGRKVEETMLHLAVETARRAGLRAVVADYAPTPKNKPCLTFLERSGLERSDRRFMWDAARPYQKPDAVVLEWEGAP